MSVLERLKKLEESATPGPWEVTKTSYPGQVLLVRGDAFTASTQLPKGDAELIAEMRNALPKLLAAIEAYKNLLNYCDSRFKWSTKPGEWEYLSDEVVLKGAFNDLAAF